MALDRQAPVIGVLLDESMNAPASSGAFSRRPYYALRKDYFTAIARAGGAAVALPYDAEAIETYLRLCDGFVLPGGDYRFPANWYAEPPPARIDIKTGCARRSFEIEFAKRLLDDDAPVLGICQGMQTLAGLTGGAMIWDADALSSTSIRHAAPAKGTARHAVAIEGAGVLPELWGADSKLDVNSAHVEAVCAAGLFSRVTARAEDGFIEAIEVEGRRFAVGVQWHPELMIEDERSLALFQALIQAAAPA